MFKRLFKKKIVIDHEKQLADWEKNGRPSPPPHIVKQMAIEEYRKKYNIDTLIETGTFLGDMVEAQRDRFEVIYSIELSEKLFRKATSRFKPHSKIKILQGDSGIVLNKLVSEINQPALFWLDGHYSGGITAKGTKECPVPEELEIILKSHLPHVILIDDARLFNGTHDYPTIDEIKQSITKSGKHYFIGSKRRYNQIDPWPQKCVTPSKNKLMFKVGTTNESARVKWIEETLKKIPQGLTILDAGAGESQFKKFCDHLNILHRILENTPVLVKLAYKPAAGTIRTLILFPISFQFHYPINPWTPSCVQRYSSTSDPAGAIKEFGRLAKPGGYLLITAPFASLTHFAPFHFASGLSRFFYEKYLPENGFKIIDLQLNGNYFEYIAQENRRIRSIAKKYAGKELNIFQRIIIQLNLQILQTLSNRDKGSSELLCYGIHVFAKKT